MLTETVEGPGGTQATHNAPEPAGAARNGRSAVRAQLEDRANRAVEVSTDYLRSHDLDEMRHDLEREIRAHPIKSLAIAIGAGYVLGKIMG